MTIKVAVRPSSAAAQRQDAEAARFGDDGAADHHLVLWAMPPPGSRRMTRNGPASPPSPGEPAAGSAMECPNGLPSCPTAIVARHARPMKTRKPLGAHEEDSKREQTDAASTAGGHAQWLTRSKPSDKVQIRHSSKGQVEVDCRFLRLRLRRSSDRRCKPRGSWQRRRREAAAAGGVGTAGGRAAIKHCC